MVDLTGSCTWICLAQDVVLTGREMLGDDGRTSSAEMFVVRLLVRWKLRVTRCE